MCVFDDLVLRGVVARERADIELKKIEACPSCGSSPPSFTMDVQEGVEWVRYSLVCMCCLEVMAGYELENILSQRQAFHQAVNAVYGAPVIYTPWIE